MLSKLLSGRNAINLAVEVSLFLMACVIGVISICL
jgi:hypothetical protein